MERFQRRRLRDDYVYLFLDGVVLKVRDGAGKVRGRVVLVACGIRAGGQREIVAYRLAQGKSEAAWTAFLRDLFLRDPEGRRLQLITTHESTGLRAALSLGYPQVPLQLCWAHKLLEHRRQGSQKGKLLRERGGGYLPSPQSKPGRAGFPALGGALAGEPAARRGQPGASPRGTPEILCGPGSALEAGALSPPIISFKLKSWILSSALVNLPGACLLLFFPRLSASDRGSGLAQRCRLRFWVSATSYLSSRGLSTAGFI